MQININALLLENSSFLNLFVKNDINFWMG